MESWAVALARILAVNLFVLVLLGAGLFFLDSYRTRLIEDREAAARMQTEFLANSLPLVGAEVGLHLSRLMHNNINRASAFTLKAALN